MASLRGERGRGLQNERVVSQLDESDEKRSSVAISESSRRGPERGKRGDRCGVDQKGGGGGVQFAGSSKGERGKRMGGGGRDKGA